MKYNFIIQINYTIFDKNKKNENIRFIQKEKKETILKLELTYDEIFNVQNFNYWFCKEYDGYDGHKGSSGIFKRLDKLSPNMIEDWFKHLNINYNLDDTVHMNELIRKNWLILIDMKEKRKY